MSHPTHVPAFSGQISFNAQHSPMGAFTSFTCGLFGKRGGLAAQLGKPANQDIYIGVKNGDRSSEEPLMCLPFYEGANFNAAAAFDVEKEKNKVAQKPTLLTYAEKQIKRHYGWGTDRWCTPDFEFTIYTPFGPIPSPEDSPSESRYRLLPAVIAELTVDNTHGKTPKTACFALNFPESGVRILDEGLESSIGFSQRDQLGFAGRVLEGDAFPIFRWLPDAALRDLDNPVHHIGSTPGFGFVVPAHSKRTLRLALGVYLGGDVTSRIAGRYRYTRYFSNLTDVLNSALSFSERIIEEARERDSELLISHLSPSQQFLIAHSTRSYYGSTQLLDVGAQPWWIVNEGEYCMMNTLDLSIDHVFWELRQNPWLVKNLLNNHARYYSYQDRVKDPASGQLFPGGISFCHDQGAHNQFSPLGHSSYELPELPGCFSHMTQEQLCNWSIIAASYVATTGDRDWLVSQKPVIVACLQSMLQRDNPNPAKRNGVTGFDSSRCGSKGQEITTYDSLDHSLAQTRNNLYIATKCWATYLGLAMLLEQLSEPAATMQAMTAAKMAARTVAEQMTEKGWIPAVFEKENPGAVSRILPAIEGLIYPLFWSSQPHGQIAGEWIKPHGLFGELLTVLKKHTQTLLSGSGRGEGFNLFADGGLKLSSTSNNSWISKIAIVQHVMREVFEMQKQPEMSQILQHADAAHVRWATEGDSAYWAMSDQFVSGVAMGSKYYPRIITTTLWLK